MSGSVQTVVIESVGDDAVRGCGRCRVQVSAWIVVAGLAGHGVFDAVHGYVIENAGVPDWWSAWCSRMTSARPPVSLAPATQACRD